MNKCIKVILDKCINCDMKEVKKIIRDFNYYSCIASNKAINMWYLHTLDMLEKKREDKNFNEKDYCKKMYGKTYQNVIEGEMKKIFPLANTSNLGTLHQQLVQNNFKAKKNDILKHQANLPTYKLDTPYYFKNNSYKIRNFNGYFVDLAFFSKKGLEMYGFKIGHKFEFRIDKLEKSKKVILDRISSGEYKQGSAQIKINKKGKIELIISFEFKENSLKELNPNKVLGIDLGITKVATFSAYNKDTEEYDYFSWKENIIDGKELIRFRQKYYNLRRDLSIGSKIVGDGRIGHGYNTKMRKVNDVRDKVSNFADTYNHKVSRYIVNFAIKHECKIIQMEDLTNVTSEATERLLKNWSYYDLQQKIEYKAKQEGIEVVYIDPKYTSKRCNKCGAIEHANRNCKENQAKFKCIKCGHEDNADINASKNIAIPNIDKIIADTIKDREDFRK